MVELVPATTLSLVVWVSGCLAGCQPSSEDQGGRVYDLQLSIVLEQLDADPPMEVRLLIIGAYAPVGVPFAANVTLVVRRASEAFDSANRSVAAQRVFDVAPREFAHSDRASIEGCVYYYDKVWFDESLFQQGRDYVVNVTALLVATGREMTEEQRFTYTA